MTGWLYRDTALGGCISNLIQMQKIVESCCDRCDRCDRGVEAMLAVS